MREIEATWTDTFSPELAKAEVVDHRDIDGLFEAFDRLLKSIGHELVMVNTQSDAYAFYVEKSV